LLCLSVITGCQNFSSSSTSARVRVIDVSSDTPPVDVYQGNNAVAYNLSFGTVTSYVPVTPGTTGLTVTTAGTHQVLSAIEGSFNTATQYTLLVSNPIANLQQTVLIDRPQPAAPRSTSTAPSVRFIHQATQMGAVDIYLVPAGHRITAVNPIATNLLPGANTPYLPVPACTCTAVMLPAGTVPSAATSTAHAGTQITYANGSARTLILLDPQPTATSGPQVIAAIDTEPTS
jgi:hypothetical protein